jgi:hypothetical protein
MSYEVFASVSEVQISGPPDWDEIWVAEPMISISPKIEDEKEAVEFALGFVRTLTAKEGAYRVEVRDHEELVYWVRGESHYQRARARVTSGVTG